MDINVLLNRLDKIDNILSNQYHTVDKQVGKRTVSFREPKYHIDFISRIADEKTQILKRLNNEGLITDDDMAEFWLSEKYEFTPKINYEKVDL